MLHVRKFTSLDAIFAQLYSFYAPTPFFGSLQLRFAGRRLVSVSVIVFVN